MKIKKTIRAINWRAAGVLLMLSLWWMTPAIALALPERVECGMECCLSIGHCCCATRHALSGEDHGAHQKTEISRAAFDGGCPSNCASPPSAPQFPRHIFHRTPVSDLLAVEIPLPQAAGLSFQHESPSADPSSPRAPPVFC